MKFCLALIFFLLPLWVHGQMAFSGLTVNADEMIHESHVVQLNGNVQAIFGSHYLSAHKATIFLKEQRVVAHGKVILQNERVYMEADRIDFNYKKTVGTLYDAFIQSGKVVFEGDLIHKVSQNKYKVIRAKYSTCTNCPSSWSFTGREIEAEIGGYAHIKYPVLRVSHIPVFWLPRLWVPLKTRRQSGMLTPSLQQGSKSGSAIELSYFWAFSRNKDMTLSTKFYERQGLKGLLEYRYVIDEKSRGQFNGGLLRDHPFKNDPVSRENRSHRQKREDRSFIEYSHYFQLPGQLTQRASLSYISDLRYVRDFPEDILLKSSPESGYRDRHKAALEASRPSLENRVSLTKNTETQLMSMEGIFNVNLLQEDAKGDNDEAVHLFPEINYSLVETELFNSGVMFGFDLRYTHLIRNGLSYDNVCDNISCLDGRSVIFEGFDFSGSNLTERRIDSKRDGDFDPSKDLIRAGQRLILRPTFNYPILLGNKFELIPSATYYHKLYHFNPSNYTDPSYKQDTSQSHLETELTLSTRLSRIFGDPSNSEGLLYKHEIESQVSYVDIPFYKRSHQNFFGHNFEAFSTDAEALTDFDFLGDERVQFDYYDRFFIKKLVNFGVTNRIIRKRLRHGKPTYIEIVSLNINQSYDFKEAEGGNTKAWGPIHALLKLRLENIEFQGSSFYFPYARVAKLSSRLQIKSNLGSFMEFIYSFDPKVDDNNYYDFDNRNETGGIGIGFSTKYFVLAGGFNYSFKDTNIQSWNATTIFKPQGDCWAIQVALSQSPNNSEIISNYNVFFEFGDNL